MDPTLYIRDKPAHRDAQWWFMKQDDGKWIVGCIINLQMGCTGDYLEAVDVELPGIEKMLVYHSRAKLHYIKKDHPAVLFTNLGSVKSLVYTHNDLGDLFFALVKFHGSYLLDQHRVGNGRVVSYPMIGEDAYVKIAATYEPIYGAHLYGSAMVDLNDWKRLGIDKYWKITVRSEDESPVLEKYPVQVVITNWVELTGVTKHFMRCEVEEVCENC